MYKVLDYKVFWALVVFSILHVTGVALDPQANSTAIDSGQTVTGTIDSTVNAYYSLSVDDPSSSLVYLVLDQTPVDDETKAFLFFMDGPLSTWQDGINTEGNRYTLTYKPQNATQKICITCNSWYSESCTFNLTAIVYSIDDSPSLNNSFTVAGYVPTSSSYIYFSVNVTGHFTIEFGGSFVTAYVAAAYLPSAIYYDQASVSYGDKVNITFTGDDLNGMYYIALSQAAVYKTFPFSIRAISVPNSLVPLADGVQISGTTSADYELTYYYFDAPETGFAIQASGYINIYVRQGSQPDFSTYDQEFYVGSETVQNFLIGDCAYANSFGGRWFIGIYGISQAYTLTATSSYSSVPTLLSLDTTLSDSVSGVATLYSFSVSSTSDLISIDMDLTVFDSAYYADYMSMKVAAPGSCVSQSNYKYAGSNTGDGRITLVFLPQETGNYSIYVDSQYSLSLTYTITVSSDVNGAEGLHLQSSTPWAGYIPNSVMMYFTVHTYTTGFILSVSGYWLSIYVQESVLPSSYSYLQYAYSDSSTSTNVTLCDAEPGNYYIALYQTSIIDSEQPFSINVFNAVGSVTQLNPWVDLQGTATSNPVYYAYSATKGDTLIVNVTSPYSEDYLYLYGGEYTSSYECDSSPSIPSTYQGSTYQEATTLIYKVNETGKQLFAVLSTIDLVSFSINLQIVDSYFGTISLDGQTSVSAYTDITGLLFTLDVSSATTLSFTTSGTITVYASNTISNPSASSYIYTTTSNGDISIDPCSTSTDSGAWYFTVISEYGLTSVQISIKEGECETIPIYGSASTGTVSNVGVIAVSAIAGLCVLIGLILCAVAIKRRCSSTEKKYTHIPVIPGNIAPVIAVKEVNEPSKNTPPQGSHIQQPSFPQYPHPPQTPYPPHAPFGPYVPFYNQTMAYYMPTQQNEYPPMFMPQVTYLPPQFQMQIPPQHSEETNHNSHL